MLLKRVLFLSVFFRDHNIRHHQIEAVPGTFLDTGIRSEAEGRVRTRRHGFEAHGRSCATGNRGDLGRSLTAAAESS
jgi:hypothetical protein